MRKSKIEVRVEARLEQLMLEMKQIYLQTENHQKKMERVQSKIIMLEELLMPDS